MFYICGICPLPVDMARLATQMETAVAPLSEYLESLRVYEVLLYAYIY